jgi:hypothetical protein
MLAAALELEMTELETMRRALVALTGHPARRGGPCRRLRHRAPA